MKTAQDFIDEIFLFTKDMSDEEFCSFLEEIAGACEDAANIKREEMSRKLND